MREVKGMASVMRDTIKELRAAHVQATDDFKQEVTTAKGNLMKMKSMTADLREANREVEKEFAGADSNFPTSEGETPKQPSTSSGTLQVAIDTKTLLQNGVTPNPDAKGSPHVDGNGVAKNA